MCLWYLFRKSEYPIHPDLHRDILTDSDSTSTFESRYERNMDTTLDSTGIHRSLSEFGLYRQRSSEARLEAWMETGQPPVRSSPPERHGRRPMLAGGFRRKFAESGALN